MEETLSANQLARDAFAEWQHAITKNVYSNDSDFIHTIHYYFKDHFATINAELTAYGAKIATQLEPLVTENHAATNLPRLETYDGIGRRCDRVIHHPSYIAAGDIIYGSKLMAHFAKPGGLLEGLSFFFLGSEAGEAGHHCPIACSAGILRVLQKVGDFPHKEEYIAKLIAPSYHDNYTGAQFLTEIQGGSDVGLNATYAKQHNDTWRIYGEKWFCSNANADLIFMTARFDQTLQGTKGLGLFLVPATWNHANNHYTLRRLKEKLGTRTMATAEIDFHGAYAYLMGTKEEGFKLVMENVLHISRLFNTFCVLGMARRAYMLALHYAKFRQAFGNTIIHYPLVNENLARIKVENTAMIAGIYATTALQDRLDCDKTTDPSIPLLLRLLVNIQKYLSAKLSVEHIHHALDIFAGNGTIETFSSIPRLLRDCIICENWEGTHYTLQMQVLKDIHKYQIDDIFITHLRRECDQLQGQSPYVDTLQTEITRLAQTLQTFRNLDPELQTLQIQKIVHSMAIVYCALRLLFEALDEFKTQESTSKLDCLQYFLMINGSHQEVLRNQDYLTLIKRINSY